MFTIFIFMFFSSLFNFTLRSLSILITSVRTQWPGFLVTQKLSGPYTYAPCVCCVYPFILVEP